eukprot:COSAG02_NODE_5545_length_4243_cov_2.175193_3_plen_196_part_00
MMMSLRLRQQRQLIYAQGSVVLEATSCTAVSPIAQGQGATLSKCVCIPLASAIMLLFAHLVATARMLRFFISMLSATINRDLRHGQLPDVDVPNEQGAVLFSELYAGHDCWTHCCEQTTTPPLCCPTRSCYLLFGARVLQSMVRSGLILHAGYLPTGNQLNTRSKPMRMQATCQETRPRRWWSAADCWRDCGTIN